MMEITMDGESMRKWRKVAVAMAAGGVSGFVAAFAFLQLADSGTLGAMDTSREIAALIGLLYVVTGIGGGFGALNPSVGARFLNVEDPGELREQRRMLSLSATGMIALGCALMLQAIAAPAGPVPQAAALAGTLLLVILATWLGLRQRRYMDELMNAVSQEATAIAFYLVAIGGGGWATLAHLDYVSGPAMLDWLTILAVSLLLGAFGVCARRGMLKPR